MNILTVNGGRPVDDLTGKVFGLLVVTARDLDTVSSSGRKPNWLCLCSCGSVRSVPRQSLTKGNTTNCGCVAAAKMPRANDVYGWLTVVSKDSLEGESLSRSAFVCQCICGVVKSIKTKNLLQGSKSCGCLRKIRTSEATLKDLSGLRFGRWSVADRSITGSRTGTGAWWNCACDCGTERPVKSDSLISGKSLSCGCLHKEIVTEVGKAKKTHGETKTRLYNVWAGMKARCYDENQSRFKDYGGRGIEICDQWGNSYEAFRDWAIAAGYESELTIERLDVNGNYCPENCKFITMADQARNKRNTVHLTAWGESKKLDEWLQDSRCTVPSVARLRDRLTKGWSPEDAISKYYIAVSIKSV